MTTTIDTASGAPPGSDDGWVRVAEDPAAVRDHPAASAWATLRPGAAVAAVDALPRKRPTLAAVYRLLGAAGPGRTVIAKYCEAATIAVERRVYQEVLPAASVWALHCHGTVGAPDGEHAWLFLEEGRGVPCSPVIRAHQALAAQWLARMHTATSALRGSGSGSGSSSALPVPPSLSLPDRGPGWFLWHLRSLRDAIQASLRRSTIGRAPRSLLGHVRGHCDRIEGGWRTIEQRCAQMPRSLVHGDYVSKNLRVARHGGQTALIVMDWEMAGWGTPAPDLHTADLNAYLTAYRAAAADRWPELTMEQLQEWAHVGRVLRLLAETHWEAQRRSWDGPAPALHRLEGYALALTNAERDLGLR